jgi:hypothetical protein
MLWGHREALYTCINHRYVNMFMDFSHLYLWGKHTKYNKYSIYSILLNLTLMDIPSQKQSYLQNHGTEVQISQDRPAIVTLKSQLQEHDAQLCSNLAPEVQPMFSTRFLKQSCKNMEWDLHSTEKCFPDTRWSSDLKSNLKTMLFAKWWIIRDNFAYNYKTLQALFQINDAWWVISIWL